MVYVDGFVLPVPLANLDTYRRMARRAGKVWIEHGALEYRECVGDDLTVPDAKGKDVPAFPRLLKLKDGETVIFAWIVYRSKAHRDEVTARVFADPRLTKMGTEAMPFDMRRMAYGGFRAIVDMKKMSRGE